MKYLLVFASCIFFNFKVSAQLSFVPRASNLGASVDVVKDPVDTNRLFIVVQTGQIKIVDASFNVLSNSFLDISSLLKYGGERGLLSVAFHPSYKSNGFFFVLYTALNGDLTLARYKRSSINPDSADIASGIVLKSISHSKYSNHNGGKLNFGMDGYLYWSTGDGGSGGDPDGNAQNGKSLLGKMLRYDVNNFNTPPYISIPPTNPFISDTAIADDVWALGLRNPFRWSFDQLTGDMWIADVGQNQWEEVNKVAFSSIGGENYGWKCREGNHVYSSNCTTTIGSLVDPIFEYDHSMNNGGLSITGGYVYRGTWQALYGKYICADYVSGNVWLLSKTGNNYTSQIFASLPNANNITGFGEGANGDLFAVSLNGDLYEIYYQLVSLPEINPTKIPISISFHDENDQILLLSTTVPILKYRIMNIKGVTIIKGESKLQAGQHVIPISHLLNGLYFAEIFTEKNERKALKFFKN